MQAAEEFHECYRFGDFTLDVGRGVLLCGTSVVKLRPQSFDVLRYLVENHGRLVLRDELFTAIWNDTVVSDGALTQCLIDIRKAIGDKSRDAIRTVPRRGYVFSESVEKVGRANADERPAESARGRIPLRQISVAALVLLVVVATAWWTRIERPVAEPGAIEAFSVAPRSIAVLPFVDMSESGDQEYFTDGLSEEILNLLAQIPDLRVTARTSSFSFKGQNANIDTIARQLNVGWVLEGSVRRSGDRIRVTAQLIDAKSIHAWSQTYDRNLSDVLALQADIAQAVANELEVKMLGGRLTDRDISPHAYQKYLQAKFFHSRRSDGDIEVAKRYYEEVVEIDPDFANAWAGLAGVYMVLAYESDFERWSLKSSRAVERALAADPNLAEAHARAFNACTIPAERRNEHLRRALELGPDNPLVLAVAAGAAAYNFDFEKAVELQRRAADLDPVSATISTNTAHYLYLAGRFEEAASEARIARELRRASYPDPLLADIAIAQRNWDEARTLIDALPPGRQRTQRLAMVYHATGRRELAAAAVAELTARPDDAITQALIAEVYAYQDEYEEAFRWLDRAKENVDGHIQMNQVFETARSPYLQRMRSGPRWDEWVAWDDDRFTDDAISDDAAVIAEERRTRYAVPVVSAE